MKEIGDGGNCQGFLLALTPIAMGEFWVPSSSTRTRSAEISANSPACCAATVELCAATVVLISKTESYKFIKEITNAPRWHEMINIPEHHARTTQTDPALRVTGLAYDGPTACMPLFWRHEPNPNNTHR